MQVYLTYYKESGKYYSEGVYETEKEHLYEIWEEIYQMRKQGRLPGLIEGAHEFHISVDVPDHPHNHPRLILLEQEESDESNS